MVTDEIERGNAVVIASDRFAIDDARAPAQEGQRTNDQWKAMGEVINGCRALPAHLSCGQ
jgi:hypothetical protein